MNNLIGDIRMIEEKLCPECNVKMDVLLFLGITPEFYVCPECRQAYPIKENDENIRSIGYVII